MLHLNDGAEPQAPNAVFETSLKQVEMNTFSCSGGAHANKVGDMHRYLARTGIYNVKDASLDISSLPVNKNIGSLASCLALAHTTYGGPRSQEARQTAVLMIVQPKNVSDINSPNSYHPNREIVQHSRRAPDRICTMEPRRPSTNLSTRIWPRHS